MDSLLVPADVLELVFASLRESGDSTPLAGIKRVKGGFESSSVALTTRKQRYFLKWQAGGGTHFAEEAWHLALLASTGAVRVPSVLAAVDIEGSSGFLLAEWLVPPSQDAYRRRVGRDLGTAIAQLHQARTVLGQPIPGYGPASAVASGVGWNADWIAYYRDGLLQPELARATREHSLSVEGLVRLEHMLAHLDDLLGGVPREPSLIHGDLHRNNVLCNAAGELVFVDPHPLFADRELELAYMEWVGWLSPALFQAYEGCYPTAPGRAERRDLYLLFWRLHRLHGEHAGEHAAAIEAILRLYRRA